MASCLQSIDGGYYTSVYFLVSSSMILIVSIFLLWRANHIRRHRLYSSFLDIL